MRANISGIDVGGLGMATFQGIAYSCPSCQAALSVGIDPVALKTDTINGVVTEMKKLLR